MIGEDCTVAARVYVDAGARVGNPGLAPMLASVHGRIIDGERWIAERLAFLRGRLEAELTVGERSAIEAEIEALSKERGISLGGLRAGRISRRLRRRA